MNSQPNLYALPPTLDSAYRQPLRGDLPKLTFAYFQHVANCAPISNVKSFRLYRECGAVRWG